MSNYSELIQLNYPQAGAPVLGMIICSMISILSAVVMLIVILNYDTSVNRQTSLLTRTYNITEVVLLFWVPSIFFGNVIVVTGASFNHYICYSYTFWEFLFGYLYLQGTAVEAVIHFLFVVKSSHFLIIKDDLLCTIFWRSAVAIGVATTARTFMGRPTAHLPRTYYFCTGTAPMEDVPEAKCLDTNEDSTEQYEDGVFCVYISIFFIFTIAICCENVRQMTMTSHIITKRRLLIDNIGFISKMTCTIFSCFVSFAYDEMDNKQIVAFPGSLIFYSYYLWIHPVCTIAGRMRRFWVDDKLWAYMRRVLGCPPKESSDSLSMIY